MKTQALRFTLLVLLSLSFEASLLLPPVSVAQTQDYSRLNLPMPAGKSYSKHNIPRTSVSKFQE